MGSPNDVLGTVVGGLYTLVRFLGRGGMGEVYEARSRSGQRVALKLLHTELCDDRVVVERFRREARIASQIASPFIAAIRRARIEQDSRHWIAFEYLDGETLYERLGRDGVLPFEEVRRLADDVLQGLAAAHDLGIVHRDIKPANLFLEGGGGSAPFARVRILDFGISKLRRTPTGPVTPLTDLDATIGSYAYMAPEQIRGAAGADGRADLYALGIVIIRSLSGVVPFHGRPQGQAATLKLTEDPLTHAGHDVGAWPGQLSGFLRGMVAPAREERFASAGAALNAWRTTCSQLAISPVLLAARAKPIASRDAPTQDMSGPPRRVAQFPRDTPSPR